MSLRNSTSHTAQTQPVLPADFENLTRTYQHRLFVHCYRFLGSLEDAEDALQETLLRAWRKGDTLKEPFALQAWLYRIATNVCLDMLDRHRAARRMPDLAHPPADPAAPLPEPVREPVWLEPLPEETLDRNNPGPEARSESLESVSLAFQVALQQLPNRQRAVLILRDVMDWKTQEVAETLGLSEAAVNSALQRARSALKKYQVSPSFRLPHPPAENQAAAVLSRYMQAWEAADAAGLASLLAEGAVLTMPPLPAWYFGSQVIQNFFATHLFSGGAGGRFRLVPTRANGSPALAVYQRDVDGIFRPSTLQVITLDGERISRIDCFLVYDGVLFKRFHLPETA